MLDKGMRLGHQPVASAADGDVSAIAKSTNQFAFDLYARFRNCEGNLVFSPSSVANALAMLHAGARGQTESQLATALHLTVKPGLVHAAFARWASIMTADAKQNGNELRVANALWAQHGYSILREFLDVLMTHYGAELEHIHFASAASAASQINTWVARQTEQKIPGIIGPEAIDPLTRLVFTNAVYFKGRWESPFENHQTRDASFTLEDGSLSGQAVQVPFMVQERQLKYTEGDEFQALELPYVGQTFSMIIFLPKKGALHRHKGRRGWWPWRKSSPSKSDVTELKSLDESFTFDNFECWRPRRCHQKVRVFIPKFKITWASTLAHALKAVGVSDAFSLGTADFSGMNGNRDLFVSEGTHKAYVEVNEEGTEAAAVTGMFLCCGIPEPEPEPVVFRADHPFLFLIRHTRSDTILFMGRVMDPR